MKIKAILFDLDGTLLPMDQDIFLKAYFSGISAHLAPRGYVPEELIAAIWRGTAAMIKNNGTKSNEAVFWDVFSSIYGERARADEPYFEEFYREKFPKIQSSCGYNSKSRELLDNLHALGLKTALATNPIFPAIATRERIRWAGITESDFELITTYENIGVCKPSPDYFKEVAERIGVAPEECLMVGNDVGDDMPAEKLGMRVFLLTDCLINKDGEDIEKYPHGDFDALFKYIENSI